MDDDGAFSPRLAYCRLKRVTGLHDRSPIARREGKTFNDRGALGCRQGNLFAREIQRALPGAQAPHFEPITTPALRRTAVSPRVWSAVLFTLTVLIMMFGALRQAQAGKLPKIAAGGAHTCALTANGWVQCWGWFDGGRGDLMELHSNKVFYRQRHL